MAVDMTLLKKLRDATFAPLGDCKQALEEANGDFDQAQEILRKKGILKAGKKADRETNEGIVKAISKDGRLAAIKLSCETDFVAKNEQFHEIVDVLLGMVLEAKKEVPSLEKADETVLEKLNTKVAEAVGAMGENIKLSDLLLTQAPAYAYNHPGNRVISIIYSENGTDEVAKELALQVAAMNPLYASFDDVDANEKSRLKEEYTAGLAASGKPANMIDQIVEGKIRKALGEQVLLEQEYIRDGGKRVKDILPAGFVLKGFIRWAI